MIIRMHCITWFVVKRYLFPFTDFSFIGLGQYFGLNVICLRNFLEGYGGLEKLEIFLFLYFIFCLNVKLSYYGRKW